MFHTLCEIAPQAADNAHGLFSLFSNIDGGTIGGGGIAATLGAVWYFAKMVRKIVATLFMLCVVYLVLKVCFSIDVAGFIISAMGN